MRTQGSLGHPMAAIVGTAIRCGNYRGKREWVLVCGAGGDEVLIWNLKAYLKQLYDGDRNVKIQMCRDQHGVFCSIVSKRKSKKKKATRTPKAVSTSLSKSSVYAI